MNLPFGIIEPTNYYQFAVQLFPGGYVILYSDGYTDIRRDGETLIVLAPQDQPPPRFTIAERLAAMCKTLGLVKIQ